MLFKKHGLTQVHFTDQPKGKQFFGEVPLLPHDIPRNTQHLMHDVRDFWRNQCYSALHYQQKQFENAALEHQRAAKEEVQTAAALTTSRTTAQMTSRFREIGNDVEVNSRQQLSLVQEATTEMM